MRQEEFDAQIARERRILGDLLRQSREAAGLTQQEAAARIGLTQSAISRYERGERGIDLAELRILLRCYGKSLGDFLGSGLLLIG